VKRLLYKAILRASLFLMRAANFLNPFKKARHFVRDRVKRIALTQYMRLAYLPRLRNMPRERHGGGGRDTLWQMWAQGMENAPDIVKACVASAERFRGRYRHIVLSASDARKYAKLPAHVWKKYRAGKIGEAMFADMARLSLLSLHGGIWADATCLFTAAVPEKIARAEFFMFRTDNRDKYAYSYIQNCFIAARRGNYLASAWLYLLCEYWRHEDKPADYFLAHMMFRALVTYDERAKREWAEAIVLPQAPTHAIFPHLARPYDEAEFAKLKRASFFQKVAHSWRKIRPGKKAAPDGTLFEAIEKGAAK
jgi:mannosyltransferase OCH1-like enzyme